ncbi:MAG: XdhC family protein [Treponemataceae bacterium]
MYDCTAFYENLKNHYFDAESAVLITALQANSSPDSKIPAKTDSLLSEKIFLYNDKALFSSNAIKEFYLKNKNLLDHNTATGVVDGINIFVEKLGQKPQLVLCGGGHIAQSLCPIGSMLGFDVIILDDRAEFASKELFPTAKHILCGDFQQSLQSLQSKESSYFVIITRGHVADRLCLSEIIPHKSAYVGMIGSRTKTKLVFEYMKTLGYSDDQLGRVHTPIGLSIGAKTPCEIAVSIAAQIIDVKYKAGCSSYFSADFFESLLKNDCVLATVIQKTGSVPTTIGSRMIISQAGRVFGTVGGGKIEFEAITQGQDLLSRETLGQSKENTKPFILSYAMTNKDASEAAMTCGGTVELLLEILHHNKQRLISARESKRKYPLKNHLA